jgi:undecaprenyl-diphosphatase
MFDRIQDMDRELFLFLNSQNTHSLDYLMILFSARLPWLPLYLAIIFSLFWKCSFDMSREGFFNKIVIEKRDRKAGWIMLAAILATFFLTDFLSNQIKYMVDRLRPGWDPCTYHLARVIENNRFSFSFVSSHASNVFGLAVLTSWFFRVRWYKILIFSWALIVCYSRVYVGRHFPGDVIFGAMFGTLLAMVSIMVVKYLLKRINSK